MYRHLRVVILIGLAAMAAGCAQLPRAGDPPEGWAKVALPGKPETRYHWDTKEGRRAIAAFADRSVSLIERRNATALSPATTVEFSWWVDSLPVGAHVGEAGRTDAPARVMLSFDGDHARLPQRTRMLFELAQTLSGRVLPYAALAYVWDPTLPVGSVIVHPRNDRLRKIVVESGSANLRRWQTYRRDLAADFRQAFGEDAGALLSVGLMTDSDNTQSRVQAWYGEVRVD